MLVQEVLNESKIDKENIESIVLVGGSTRILKIQSLLSNIFNDKELGKFVNPDEAVAYGDAVLTAVLDGIYSSNTPKLILRNFATMTVSIEARDGKMVRLIKRNTIITLRKRQFITTIFEGQKVMSMQVFEGEGMHNKENSLLGDFYFSEIKHSPKGIPRIKVTFEIDINGILKASAERKRVFLSRDIKVTSEKGRPIRKQIESMI